MSEFDLDLSGVDSLQAELEQLQQENEDPPEFVVGTNVEYAVYLEFGTRHMPPYSFFRPAIRELRANPETFIRKNTNFGGFGEIDNASELVTAIASALENQLKTNVTAQASGRSPGTDSEHPQVDTGTLRSSIQAVRVD